MDGQQGNQPVDIFGGLRRRAKLMATVAGVVVLAVYWIAMALPNEYSSYATILVEPQSIDEMLVRSGVRTSDLTERLGIMTARILSRQRLSKMIDKFDLYPDESKRMERQEVIDIMRSDVSVAPVISELESGKRGSRDIEFNTFMIQYRSRSAETASLVAQSIANDFLDANIKARVEVSNQSLSFMDDSIKSITEQLVSLDTQIKEVKAENAGQLPADLDTNQRILQTVSTQIREAQRSLDLAQSDEAFWKNQVIAAVALAPPKDTSSPAFRIGMLETELGVMRSKGFTEKHPDVVATLQEIDLLRARVDAEPEDEDAPGSYAEQNAKSELRRAQLRAAAAIEDLKRLEGHLVEVQERIAATPIVAERLDALQRQYDQLSTSYRDFSARRQQAVVQANLERKQLGEQFRILEAAFPAPNPTSPNRILILVVGVVFGLGLGGAVGLMAEASDSTLHRPRDLQQLVQLPVLAAVPEIVLEPDRVARSRHARRQGLIAVAVTLVCLLGGALTYFYVNGLPDLIKGKPVGEQTSGIGSAERVFALVSMEDRS